MTLFAIRDAVGIDYCITIADADYEPAFRRHAAWWVRHMKNPSKSTRDAYAKSHKGLPCFPCRVVLEA